MPYKASQKNLLMRKPSIRVTSSDVFFFPRYLEKNIADVRKQQACSIARNQHPREHQLPKCFLSYILIFLRSTPSVHRIDNQKIYLVVFLFSCNELSLFLCICNQTFEQDYKIPTISSLQRKEMCVN